MNKISIRFLFFLTGIVTSLHAQQDPLYAQYLNSPLLINPAYAGFSKDLSATLLYRKQWAGFDGSPETLNASAHMALLNNRMGAGFTALKDQIGSNKTTEIHGVYAYHLPVSTETSLSFGLQAGVINYRSDYSDLTINTNDPRFVAYSEWQPNFGAGVQLTNDKFFISLSAPKLLQASSTTTANLYNRSFYALAAYSLPLSFRLKLKPYVLIRTSANSDPSWDVGATLRGDDSYVLGVFTRQLKTYGFMAQIKLGDALRMGYVFELPTGKSVGLKFTSHELMIGLRLRALPFHDLSTVRNF